MGKYAGIIGYKIQYIQIMYEFNKNSNIFHKIEDNFHFMKKMACYLPGF